MSAVATADIREVMEAVHYLPAVSVIMPFEPKMSLKAMLTHKLRIAADKVEQELAENYPEEISMLVMHKLRTIIKDLNFNTHKKSIAIYVSPLFEKVLYLDIAVEEKIIVDESFEIRDLLYSKKQLHQYLVLLLSSRQSSIYLDNAITFEVLVCNTAESFYVNDLSQSVANFSDTQQRKQILTDKFLHHTGNTLDIILNAYPLPLFVLGTKKILGHFKKHSKHAAAVVNYVSANYEEKTLPELKQILEPHIADWEKVKQKYLLHKIEEAAGQKKLAAGMRDVWREAMGHKGKLLIVEKNFMYKAQYGSIDEVIYKAIEPYSKFSYIKDAVDDVMEKVLENGGDVEFVEENLLNDYHHIALIQYY